MSRLFPLIIIRYMLHSLLGRLYWGTNMRYLNNRTQTLQSLVGTVLWSILPTVFSNWDPTLNSETQISFYYEDRHNLMSPTLHLSIQFSSLPSVPHFIIALVRVSEVSEIVVSKKPVFIYGCVHIYVWQGEEEEYLKRPGNKNKVIRFRIF